MLKFDGIAEGKKIRSWDFQPMEGRDDSYVEGIIISDDASFKTGYESYEIYVTKDTSPLSREGDSVFVPKEVSILEWDTRVEVLEDKFIFEEYRAALMHREGQKHAKQISDARHAEDLKYEEEAMYANLMANGGA
jgi:hypothetical protein